MKAYPAYKESGYGWIGDIPEHWNIGKLKYFADVNPSKSSSSISKDSDEPVTFLPMEKVNENGTYDLSLKRPISELWNGFTYFEENDVIVAKITPCFENGKGALLDNLDGKIGFGSTEFHVIRERADVTLPSFLYYLTQSHLFKTTGEAFMYGAAGQKRVPTSHVTDFPFSCPPLPEQKAIADFLDRKTAQIDSLIEKKQRQIELLEEQRTALINQAVTKGLDPSVAMKDSGIEWLGEIPSHWELRKLKHISSVEFSNVDKHTIEGELPVKLCNYTDVYYNDFITPEMEFMKATALPREIEKFSLQKGDVLLTKDSESWDDIAVPAFIADEMENVLCGYHLAHVRPLEIFDKYLFWAFSSNNINDQYKVSANGITRYGLGKYSLENSLITIPPITEQKAIVSYLDVKNEKIKLEKRQFEKQIELLQEYRTALISAAVTGKVDVRREE